MNKIRLTGLWKSQKIEGALSGNLWRGTFLSIIPNTHKVKDSEPDFIAYLEQEEGFGKRSPNNQLNLLGGDDY